MIKREDDSFKRLIQLKSQKSKLDLMEKNIEDVINHIKNEIAGSTKRDTQLIDSRDHLLVMLAISEELACAQSSQGMKPERDSIFVRTEADRRFISS